ncbi:ABC transporter permease [Vagococcus sp. JNUCC 83]
MKQTLKKHRIFSYVIIAILAIYYLTPLIMTCVYAFGDEWGKSILPNDFTIKWFKILFQDTAFFQSIARSLLLSIIVLSSILIVMIPSVVIIYLYYPRLDRMMQSISLLPYAIPGVILVTALLKTYSKTGISMFIVLCGALFISPIMYMGIRNSLQAINAKQLIEAGHMLGANTITVIFRVVLPNLRVGIVLSSIMVFSGVFGEYVLTNLLIGGRFETLRIYMLRRMNENGHLASAVMVCYFIMIFLMGIIIYRLSNKKKNNESHLKTQQQGIINKEAINTIVEEGNA